MALSIFFSSFQWYCVRGYIFVAPCESPNQSPFVLSQPLSLIVSLLVKLQVELGIKGGKSINILVKTAQISKEMGGKAQHFCKWKLRFFTLKLLSSVLSRAVICVNKLDAFLGSFEVVLYRFYISCLHFKWGMNQDDFMSVISSLSLSHTGMFRYPKQHPWCALLCFYVIHNAAAQLR